MHKVLWCTACAVLLLGGCADENPANGPLPQITSAGGPEVVLLRLTREGGFPRSYRWPTVEIAAWTGTERLPAIARVLGFDAVGGQLAVLSDEGKPGRLDLRSGHAEFADNPVATAGTPDGVWLYGLNEAGHIWRSSEEDDWTGPALKADTLLALPGGYVVVASSDESNTHLIRLRPPATTVDDTIDVPLARTLVATETGDRIYAVTARGIVAIDVRAWRVAAGPHISGLADALAPTPSGDRAFILEEGGNSIRVWDRFRETFSGRVDLPRVASDLRMDPMGRFVLARIDGTDSAYVISVPAVRVVNTVRTGWREDLPTFSPDGALVALINDDVHLVDPVVGTRRRRLRGAAHDLWVFIRWDGFKPRDSSLDAPAVFEMDPPIDSVYEAEKIDSILSARAEIVAREQLDSIARASSGRRQDTTAVSWTLSFASLLSESAARSLAARVRVDGRPPRIVAGTRDGITIYRVVMGPFPTREAADSAGKRSGMPYWVFAGLP